MDLKTIITTVHVLSGEYYNCITSSTSDIVANTSTT
jgi:hypothetical protein